MHIRGRSRPIVQFWSVLFGAILLVVGSNLLSTPSAYASVPNGFADSVVANISAPTDIAFTPDGTMLVTSQNGGLYKRSGSSTTKVLDLSGKICSDFERGLLGVTVDPLYASNNYIYLYYTYNRHNTCIDNSPSSPNNRVSRFTFNGSSVTGETVLVDNIYSLNGNHNGGGMTFGKDGYLYISIGDSGCQLGVPSNCAGGNGNSRKKNILNGKVLRVSRDGIAPSSNPFYSAGGTCRVSGSTPADTHCKETYAWGFRNPFRIAANPNSSSTQIYVNDVGQDEWEEIDALQAGKDYGWNYCEGFTNASGGGNCGFSDTNPLYVYGHGSCNSITGGAFIPNGSWPTAYNNLYFFADYTCGTIWTLKNSGGTWSRTVFASGLGAVTELEFGPDGANVALYYTNYGSSQVRKITYTSSSNRRPTADVDASPTYGTLPLEVSFDGRDSVDPDSDSLTFAWDFGDGTSSTSSHPTKTFTQQLDYTVRLTVSDGRGGTDTDSVIIRAGNTRPTAEITAPSATSEFYVGQTIKLRGVGTDAEDSPGKIPASRMTWEVRLHHDTHFHPFFGPTTGNYLTFQAPAPEDLLAATNSYLEIRLTVRDATGLGKLVTMNLYPNKVNVTVGSNVPGMLIWIEGQPYTAPATVLTWENNPLTIEAPDQIGPDGQAYVYKSWSDGGYRKHDYDTPSTDRTVTTTFNLLGGYSYAPHADARVSQAYPDRNEGTGTGLSIKGGDGSHYETYIRFKLTGVGDTISKAKLYLYAYEGSVDGPDLYLVRSSWSETGITWNNRLLPSSGRVTGYGPVAKGSWIALDVRNAIVGDGYVTFLLRNSSADAASFYSRQAGSTKAPRLVIVSNGVGPSAEEPGVIVTTEATLTPVATATATPTIVSTATAEPTATEVPADLASPEVIDPTATEPAPLASPLPFADTFDNGLDAWVSDGASTGAIGEDGSPALLLSSNGTVDVTGAPSYVRYAAGPTDSLHVAFSLNVATLPSTPLPLVTLADSEGGLVAGVYLMPDGSLVARWNGSDAASYLGVVAIGSWQQIEVGLDATAGTGELAVWVDGSSQVTISGPVVPIASILLGSWSADQTYALAIDSVSLASTCLGSCPAPVSAPTSEPVIVTEGTPVS